MFFFSVHGMFPLAYTARFDGCVMRSISRLMWFIFCVFFLYVKMDPDDNTAIIDMKKHFQKFVSGDDTRKRSRLDLSENSLLDSSHASVGRSYGRGKCANNFF